MNKIIIILLATTLAAKHIHKESYYQNHFCKNRGQQEYTLPDKTRVDCLTQNHAIEVDFANKWAEAIGQSLYYAHITKKQPGILLILETQKDKRYLKRLLTITPLLNIKVWTINQHLKIEYIPTQDE